MRENFIISADKNYGYPTFSDAVEFEELGYCRSSDLFIANGIDYPIFKRGGYPESEIINTAFYTDGSVYPYPKFSWLILLTERPPMFPYKQKHIYVYDMSEPQNGFDNNGLAILLPTSCRIREELNGLYELTLTHPIDEYGKWKFLLELNIIKADGQLFRIYSKKTTVNNDGSMERTVNARHIFYDLADKLLDDVRPENKNGLGFISWIMAHIFDDYSTDHYPDFQFSFDSDITDTATSYFQGVSPVSALIGADNSFINRLGGELYRNNFYFSINKKREFSKENAFSIRYGLDMLKVEETIDYSDICTYLFARDNWGSVYAVSYVGTQLLHHNITKRITFNYDQFDFAQFEKDVMAYFYEHWTPKITYTVNFANIGDDERYADFMELQHCNVGDTGTVYCEQLGINTVQKVISKEYDGITGEMTIVLGSMKSSLTRTDKFSSVISSGASPEQKRLNAVQSEIKAENAMKFGVCKRLASYTYNELSAYSYRTIGGEI